MESFVEHFGLEMIGGILLWKTLGGKVLVEFISGKFRLNFFVEIPYCISLTPLLFKTLPEAQRTQDIESKTWIISKSGNKCKFQFSTFSPPPLPGNQAPASNGFSISSRVG